MSTTTERTVDSDSIVAEFDRVLSNLNCQSNVAVEKIDIVNPNLIIDLPKLVNDVAKIEIPSTVQSTVSQDMPAAKEVKIDMPGPIVEKLANVEIKRRRRSMRKHQRKKLMIKIWPKMRKEKFLKFKKKQRIMLAYKEKFKSLGDNFDALSYIKENLKVAQDNGFFVDVFKVDVQTKKAGK